MAFDPGLAVAIAAAFIGPLIAYIGASRRLSGRIGTSSADELWKESSLIRDDYRARLSHSDERTAKLEERVANLERLNNQLAHENLVLRARVEDLEKENAELKTEVQRLRTVIAEGSASNA